MKYHSEPRKGSCFSLVGFVTGAVLVVITAAVTVVDAAAVAEATILPAESILRGTASESSATIATTEVAAHSRTAAMMMMLEEDAAQYVTTTTSSDSGSLLRANSVSSATITASSRHNMSDPFVHLEMYRTLRAQVEKERRHRLKDRRLKNTASAAQRVWQKLPKSPEGKIERVTEEEWKKIDATQKQRGLFWFGDSSSSSRVNGISASALVDPSVFYDKWAQGYRMLGGFIDCDHDKSKNSRDNNNGDNENGACSRWMMWASVRVLWCCCLSFCV